MKIVIEIADDLEDDERLKRYLMYMQQESDMHAAESPDDYWEGFGSMGLETPHMSVAAKIIGVLRERETHDLGAKALVIEPITPE